MDGYIVIIFVVLVNSEQEKETLPGQSGFHFFRGVPQGRRPRRIEIQRARTRFSRKGEERESFSAPFPSVHDVRGPEA